MSRIVFFPALVACAFIASIPTALAMCTLDSGPKDFFTVNDQQRFQRLYESRIKGLTGALRTGNQLDRNTVAATVEQIDRARDQPSHSKPDTSSLEGDYRCQNIKLGRSASIIIYSMFDCRITLEGKTAIFHKHKGSQRLRGKLVAHGSGFAFAGSGYYTNEKPGTYGSNLKRDVAGCMVPLPNGWLALEMPDPVYDSDHDFMLLRPHFGE